MPNPTFARSFIVALLGLAASGALALAHGADRLAIVEDYSGDRASISIERAGVAQDLALGTELFAGDQISVDGNGYVVLRFNSGSQHVDAATSPYTVSDASGTLEDMSSNFGRVLDVVAWWDDSGSNAPMRSRDGVPPVIAALERVAEPQVLAGERALHLAWVDGKGPFEVTLSRDGAEIASVATAAGIRETQLAARLEAGATYALDLIDAGRDGTPKTTYRFVAVDALPQTSVSIPEDDELRPLLAVAELASVDRGRWAFEALQQLYALSDGSRFRKALINAIEHGDHP